MTQTRLQSLFEATEGGRVGDRVVVEVPDEWCILGPNGGFVAACALRASGPHLTGFAPIGVTASFLRPMSPGAIELAVTPTKIGRRSGFVSVEISQGDQPVARVEVVAAAPAESLEVARSIEPTPPPPSAVSTLTHLRGESEPAGFERVLEQRPLAFMASDHERVPAEPDYDAWFTFAGQARHDDPFVDLGRLLVITDVMPYAALDVRFPVLPATHWLPTLRLSIECGQGIVPSASLLARSRVSAASGGIVNAGVTIFGEDGIEVATGSQLGTLIELG